MLVYQTMTHIC